MSKAPKIAVIYWSLYGHVEQLAAKVAEGVEAAGVHVDIYQVPETLSDDALKKMHAKDKSTVHPKWGADKFEDYDGYLLGIPTRYGRAPSQWDTIFDRTGGLWAKGALVNKFCGIFFSTSGQHGGQETTALTTIPYLVHHGMIYVPIGYAAPELSDMQEIVGGSPYGAGTISGTDGSRQPSEKEFSVCKFQGQHFAKVVSTYVKGLAA